ncbi:MAG TPA: DSD1 family PLP-dependent enzyme [Acidimicrobiales bacterium]
MDRQPRYSAALNRLGEPGSRELLTTPALVCDRELLEANISRMATMTASLGVALRPHVKSHKSAYVAKLQLDGGAVGLAFAKLSEAEAVISRLRSDGYESRVSALLTSPITGLSAARRALTLAEHCDLMVVVDHPDAVDELAVVTNEMAKTLSVLCDVDVGLSRTGVVGPAAALEVVQRIAANPRLSFAGVQGYGGHLQHIAGREQRFSATSTSAELLVSVIEALEANGFPVALRTGGGTGTAAIDGQLGVLNELQCGSYVFMDREYRDALGSDPEGAFHQSLTIATTVISTNQLGFVTVDAGLKSMATDAGSPVIAGHECTSAYHFFGDEHGMITTTQDTTWHRGDRIDLVPPHCDPTVDRYDELWLVSGDVVVGVEDIVARGCSQ